MLNVGINLYIEEACDEVPVELDDCYVPMQTEWKLEKAIDRASRCLQPVRKNLWIDFARDDLLHQKLIENRKARAKLEQREVVANIATNNSDIERRKLEFQQMVSNNR